MTTQSDTDAAPTSRDLPDWVGKTPRPDEITYSPECLFSVSLPYRPPTPDQTDNGVWVRRSKYLKLSVFNSLGCEFIPYGIYPRLFTHYLANQVRRDFRDSKPHAYEVSLESSMRQFCISVGVAPHAGKRGTARKLLEQIAYYIRSTIELERNDYRAGISHQRTISISSERLIQAVEDSSTPGEFYQNVRTCGFTLSTEFVDELLNHSVPLDARIAQHCASSPFKLDVYHSMAHQQLLMHQREIGTTRVSWGLLKMQSGATYTAMRDFRAAYLAALQAIRAEAWPELSFEVDQNAGELVIHQSPLALPKREVTAYLRTVR